MHKLRITHRKGTKTKLPRYLVKCGCCSEKVEIFYGHGGLEINGVWGEVAEWGKIFMRALNEASKKEKD